MVAQPGRPSPDHHVAVRELHAARLVGPAFFSVIQVCSQRVVEDDADRVPVPRPNAADPVPEIDPIHSAAAPHRPMVDREDDAVTLSQGHDFGP